MITLLSQEIPKNSGTFVTEEYLARNSSSNVFMASNFILFQVCDLGKNLFSSGKSNPLFNVRRSDFLSP